MSVWNGMTVTPEAHRIALQIEAKTGLSKLSVCPADVRSTLRAFYSATGGKRGNTASCYQPNSAELVKVYNGEMSGAEVHAMHRGAGAPEAPKAPVEAATADIPVVVDTEGSDDAVEVLRKLLGGQKIDPEAVRIIATTAVDGRVGEVLAKMDDLVALAVSKAVRKVEFKIGDRPAVTVDTAHRDLQSILSFCLQRQNLMIKGPAACGKTHIAKQIAQIMGLPHGFAGKTIDETKILGYMDGGGTYRGTTFRQIWEFGGVFLADEMDTWAPEALIALNAALAGDLCDFPDGMVQKHADTVLLAATNTNGTGADAMYNAREVLDFASRNRFAYFAMDYDEDLELAICCNDDWTRYIQKIRAAIRTVGGVDTDVTPRDSMGGGIMLATGMDRTMVEEAYIWRGMEQDTRNRILAAVR